MDRRGQPGAESTAPPESRASTARASAASAAAPRCRPSRQCGPRSHASRHADSIAEPLPDLGTGWERARRSCMQKANLHTLIHAKWRFAYIAAFGRESVELVGIARLEIRVLWTVSEQTICD